MSDKREINIPVTGEARGRNGYFKANEVRFERWDTPGDGPHIIMGIRAKRSNAYSPASLTITPSEARQLAVALEAIAED